ncbi:MAG: DUF882 domain-containing protein [Proteobacteria bacterium]|nr:DUF882 domain-containing protein [Pseudomonadota bacterium]
MLLGISRRAAWARVCIAVVFAALAGLAVPASASAATKARHSARTAHVGHHHGKRHVVARHHSHRHARHERASHRRYAHAKRHHRVAESRRAGGRRTYAGGGGVTWRASSGCLNGTLRGIISDLAGHFGPITVNSTCRSRSHNAAVGGAHRSMHLTGDAVDFRVHGSYGGVASYVRGRVGGFKHYGGGLFHIDTGPRRTW